MNSFSIFAIQDNATPSSTADINAAFTSALQMQSGCSTVPGLNGYWSVAPAVTQSQDALSWGMLWGSPSITTTVVAGFAYDLPAGATDQAVQTCIQNLVDGALAVIQPSGSWQPSQIFGAIIGPTPGQSAGQSGGSAPGPSPAPPATTVQQVTSLIQVSAWVVAGGVVTWLLWPLLTGVRATVEPVTEKVKARSRRTVNRIRTAQTYDDWM